MRAVLPTKPAPAKPVTTVRFFTGISEVSTISTLDNAHACDEVRHGNNNMCGSFLKALDASDRSRIQPQRRGAETIQPPGPCDASLSLVNLSISMMSRVETTIDTVT